ncbi:MAG TPA: hypothetical protein VII55_03130 [Candidatus Saccharimonadales bacterium]
MAPEAQKYLAQRVANAIGLSPTSRVLKMLNNHQANLPLVRRRQYEKALKRPHGELRGLPTAESQELLEGNIKLAPTESKALLGKTGKTQVSKGNEGLVVVTYPLILPELEDERNRLTGFIDVLNGVNTYWGSFVSNVIVAMFDETDDRAEAIEAGFEMVRPEAAVLTGARVLTLNQMENISG